MTKSEFLKKKIEINSGDLLKKIEKKELKIEKSLLTQLLYLITIKTFFSKMNLLKVTSKKLSLTK
jgi:hypothetical protein